MIVRIWKNSTNQIVVSYPNLKDISRTPQAELQLCDYVWSNAVSSKLVSDGQKEDYRFELIKHSPELETKQPMLKINDQEILNGKVR